MIEMAAVVDASFRLFFFVGCRFPHSMTVVRRKDWKLFLRFWTMRVIIVIRVFPVRKNQHKYYEVLRSTNLQLD
jgi:hypothetical protein